jgi:quinol-cytochrome oxidoreductase complex cytochrome b subunit
VVGVLLFVLTLLLSLSGYLPPWDRLSVWAFTVGMTLGGAGPLLRKHVNLLLLGHFETGQNTPDPLVHAARRCPAVSDIEKVFLAEHP